MDRPLIDGLTPADVSRYTEGNCAQLAAELLRLAGWPMRALSEPHWPHRPIYHVFSECAPGVYLDAKGTWTASEIASYYGWPDWIVIETSEEDLKAWRWQGGWYGDEVRLSAVVRILVNHAHVSSSPVLSS